MTTASSDDRARNAATDRRRRPLRRALVCLLSLGSRRSTLHFPPVTERQRGTKVVLSRKVLEHLLHWIDGQDLLGGRPNNCACTWPDAPAKRFQRQYSGVAYAHGTVVAVMCVLRLLSSPPSASSVVHRARSPAGRGRGTTPPRSATPIQIGPAAAAAGQRPMAAERAHAVDRDQLIRQQNRQVPA